MVEKKISLLEFESNPNIGLYLFANDKFCLVGTEISSNKKKEIEKILNVPVYKITVLGTDLVGVFISGNNDFLLIPNLYDYELNLFKEICETHNINLININETFNTFGNNICVSDSKIILNPNYSVKFKNSLKKKTNLEIITLKNKEFESVGSICRFLNGKFFLAQEIKETEVKKFSKEVGGIGTINSGSNYISSGVVGNKFGLLIGSNSTTIEIQNITQSLDYI